MSIDAIRKKQVSEVRALRRPNRARLIQYVVLCALFASIVSVLPGSRRPEHLAALEAAAANHLQQFQADILLSVDWLSQHGYGFELQLFESGAGSVSSLLNRVDSNSIFFPLTAIFCEGLIHVLFILIASFRFWLLCIGLGVVAATKGFRPYVGDDLLGETGIGKLFYSGIRADLSQITAEGAPNQLVTNLATLKKVSRDKAQSSAIASILSKHSALNETTIELTQHLLAFPQVPYFAPPGDEQYLATKETILEMTPTVLDELLSIFSKNNARNQVQSEIFRVIEPFRDALTHIDCTEIAALFLAMQAGKVMGYLKEGNRWVQRSSFINLNARSVIHSVPAYKTEYSYEQRQRIRQSLVYAKRFSVFGPVRLPIELSDESRALRQLAEIFLAPPSEYKNALDDIELYARSVTAYQKFEARWFHTIEDHQHSNQHAELFERVLATESGLVCVDVAFVVSVMDTVLLPSERDRISELVSRVSQTQSSKAGTANKNYPSASDVEPSRGPLPQYQKIFLPIPFAKIRELSRTFSIPEEVLHAWSIYRNIFNSFGWLTRQVGTTTVPEESCCYIVFLGAQWAPTANQLGL